MTDTNKTIHDYDGIKQQFKEKAWPLTTEKRERSKALQIAFSDQPKRLGAEVNNMYKRLNATWLKNNKGLVKAYREAVKEKRAKKVEEIFQEIVEKVKAINPKIDQEALKDFISNKKESNEILTNLPFDVATQETKAIAYFKQNNEANHLKVVDHVKKLREQGKISYEDLGWREHNVIMPYGSKKLKMYFPADTHLSNVNYNYTDFDGKKILKKEITKWKLWSKEWEKYVEQKEKEWQKMLSESEFKTLIQSLYPEWTEEEQILAFMMATWFYGRIRLSDKILDFQRVVICSHSSVIRSFFGIHKKVNKDKGWSLVYSTFVG